MQSIQTPTRPFVRVRMPLPPSVNQSYQPVRAIYKGNLIYRIGPTSALNQFKKDATLALSDARNQFDWALIDAIKESKRNVALDVKLKFFFVSLWRRDVDGGVKSALDVVFSKMGLNDNLIVSLQAEKLVDASDPRCEIEISCILNRS